MSELLERSRGFVTVERIAPPGMVALKGDLGAQTLIAALRDGLDLPMPEMRCWTEGAAGGEGGRAFWMAPDELLLMVPDAGAAIASLQARLGDAFVSLADVSDLRAMFTIRGAHSTDALAKLAPVDFSDLSPGHLRRSRLAQTAAMIWCEAPDAWGLVCFRSVADYAMGLLSAAARPGGEVGLYR